MTLKWWTHLWLKEGYATWIEFLCVDHLFPQWDIWTQFLTDTLNPAKSLDSLSSSHPIEVSLNSKIDCSNLPLGTSINFLIKVEVENPAQVDEIFDLISYNKGASVIRMLFDWIGEANFKKGMNA